MLISRRTGGTFIGGGVQRKYLLVENLRRAIATVSRPDNREAVYFHRWVLRHPVRQPTEDMSVQHDCLPAKHNSNVIKCFSRKQLHAQPDIPIFTSHHKIIINWNINISRHEIDAIQWTVDNWGVYGSVLHRLAFGIGPILQCSTTDRVSTWQNGWTYPQTFPKRGN